MPICLWATRDHSLCNGRHKCMTIRPLVSSVAMDNTWRESVAMVNTWTEECCLNCNRIAWDHSFTIFVLCSRNNSSSFLTPALPHRDGILGLPALKHIREYDDSEVWPCTDHISEWPVPGEEAGNANWWLLSPPLKRNQLGLVAPGSCYVHDD